MTLLLSVPEFFSQHPEMAERRQKVRSPWTVPLRDPSGKNQGYRQSVNLRPGLNIMIDDYTLQEDLVVKTAGLENHRPQLGVEMSFMLSAQNAKEEIPAHHNFLDAGWREGSTGGIFPWQSDQRVLKFDIHIESTVFNDLLGSQVEALPASLIEVIQSSSPARLDWCFYQLSVTTPAMRSAIHQMLHCPYQGTTRWIFWEGKVLELIALKLEQISQCKGKTTSLKGDDIDRIHHAREILHQRIVDPPSLLELAKLVGLNDYKLKVGFKQAFGTTVFGDLRRHRLAQARQLLLERQISVAAAAAAVGYTSEGHFAAAFRKQFGINPREVCR